MRVHLQPAARRALRAIAIFAVVGGFLWALWGQVGEIAAHEWHLSWGSIVLAVICALARGPLIALPWWRILQGWGYSLAWWRSLRVYFHSGLARYLPGHTGTSLAGPSSPSAKESPNRSPPRPL